MKKLLRRLGGGSDKAFSAEELPRDLSPGDTRILDQVRPYTMTGALRIEALLKAVRYCVQADQSGAFVECGVWRGGSVLAMILQLQQMGVSDRDIYLYDTFEGMTEPTEEDTSPYEDPALATWRESEDKGEQAWSGMFNQTVFNEDDVRAVVESTGYPSARLHFVRGPVEETIPATLPENIALLRLDTDWYESTRHEMEHMYPLITSGGVLIIDDYGHWEGARLAVDEYFARDDVKPLLLHRIDYTGRTAIKV